MTKTPGGKAKQKIIDKNGREQGEAEIINENAGGEERQKIIDKTPGGQKQKIIDKDVSGKGEAEND